ncbi:phospholipid phosphatase 1-like [Tubulanus polymorphus]|uniref:phospholipid phosphatase 1-like n=1 Tax=Tubulanus polymorphus TaxID=672921 RepID=UPI003DA6BF1E
MEESSSAYIIRHIIIDFICVACVAIPAAVFKWGVSPYHRGFYCNDESLMHPFKDSTVTSAVLGVVGAGVPILTIILVEGLTYRFKKPLTVDAKLFKLGNLRINRFVFNCYKYIGLLIFNIFVNQFFTDVGKYSIGRLRPHFFAVCKPDYSKFNCSSGYIESYVCTGTDSYNLKNARLSFPSGHASMSFASMLYLTLYIQYRFQWKGSHLLKHVLQIIAMMLAFACTLSRVSDYKHHWSDVLGGAVLGCIVTICVVVGTTDFFRPIIDPNLYAARKKNDRCDITTSPKSSTVDPVAHEQEFNIQNMA